MSLLTLSILTCLGTTNLTAESAKEKIKPHDYYKQKAIQQTQDTKEALNKKFDALMQQLKENPPTGEKKHDEYILYALEQNQKDWLNYQYSYCQSTTLLEVYPRESRLFVQTLNSCLSKLNFERVQYLNDLIKDFKK